MVFGFYISERLSPPAAVSIKLIYPAAYPSLSDVEKPFLFSDLAALTKVRHRRSVLRPSFSKTTANEI